MKLLFIGDIVGKPGRTILRELLPRITKERGIDFVIANAENAAGGSGVTPPIAEELLASGIDVLTSGDHIWKKKEIQDYLDKNKRVLRPHNYPEGAPGSGARVFESGNGEKIAVLNLIGRVFMQAVDCPFAVARKEIKKIRQETHNIFIDIHAEATSEKIALGWYLDGTVTGIFGSHTHVQTADEKVLPRGTAYITDAGMTGPFDSVIGRRKEEILERFITQMPTRFQMAEDDVRINGAIVTFDEKKGTASGIERLEEKYG